MPRTTAASRTASGSSQQKCHDCMQKCAVIGGAALTGVLATWLIYSYTRKEQNTPTRYLQRLSAGLKQKFAPSPMAKGHDVVVVEKGAKGQEMNERMYMQLLWLSDERPEMLKTTATSLHSMFKTKAVPHIIYDDVNNFNKIALLTWSPEASHFPTVVRETLQKFPTLRVQTPMFGKTYSNGHEVDLKHALMKKPVHAAMKETSKYAIWYPLRRCGSFYMQNPFKQCKMLLEHAVIGRAFGEAGHANDIRLNSYGLDQDDNEFVIGIVGKELAPLSKVIQDMRKTDHTSRFMEKLGPFFVGVKKHQYPETFQQYEELATM